MEPDSKPTAHWLPGTLAVGLLAAAAFARIQYATPYIAEYDGYFHIRLAQILGSSGLVRSFPWLPFSGYADGFADLHLLFHVLLVPFTWLGLMQGAKLYAVASSVAVVLVFYGILRSQGIRGAPFWVLGLFTSTALLYRFALPKASQASLVFLLLGLWFIWSGRRIPLFLLSLLYTWLYVGFPILLVCAFIHLFVSLLYGERGAFLPLALTAGGMVAGLLLNPYFPDNLLQIHAQLFEVSTLRQVPMGSEWYPWDTWYFLKETSMVFACIFLAGLFALLREERANPKTVTLFLFMVFLMLLSFRSRRFVEYFVPFGLLFSAFALSGALADAARDPGRRPLLRVVQILGILLMGLAAVPSVERTARDIRASARDTQNALYGGCAAWLEGNTAEGEIVFNTDWDDFPALFFHDTRNRYVAGLDPNFLLLYDPDMWRDYAEVTLGQRTRPADTIRGTFGARYVFTDRKHAPFVRSLEREGRSVLRYEDAVCAVYEIED